MTLKVPKCEIFDLLDSDDFFLMVEEFESEIIIKISLMG
jgi:hypothetical protein